FPRVEAGDGVQGRPRHHARGGREMSRTKGRGHRSDDVTSTIRRWEPRDWEELVAAWEELVPESARPISSNVTQRRFQDSPLTAQQAGKVFERWIIGAFRA